MTAGAAASGPTGTRGMAPQAAAFTALLLAVTGTAAALRIGARSGEPTPEDVDLTLPEWRASEGERAVLAEVERVRLAAAPREDDETVRALDRAYAAFDEADRASAGDTRSRTLADAHAEYQQWALTALQTLGADAYMGHGARLAARFVEALRTGDEAAQVRLAGTFADHLRSTGVLRPGKALDASGEALVKAAFLARWAQAVAPQRPTGTLLAAEERVLLLRWKLAANPLVGPERRREVARELEKLGSVYAVHEALGKRAADEGRWDLCARSYEDAARARPEDRRLRANALYCAARGRP